MNFFHQAVLYRNYFIAFLKTYCNLKQITKDFKLYVCAGILKNTLLVNYHSEYRSYKCIFVTHKYVRN